MALRTAFVRDLRQRGHTRGDASYRKGLAKLVPEKEARRFADSYVSTSVLAKRLHLDSGSLARHLNESGASLLTIPDPDSDRGHGYFLPKEVAAQIRFPTRRMLLEKSQRRQQADRKKKWAEYRLARESALGRPLRRVRTNIARD